MVGVIMKVSSSLAASPNLNLPPLFSAAFFHSTPFLTVKKHVHDRNHPRGPPSRGFKVVFKKPQFPGSIDYKSMTYGGERRGEDSSKYRYENNNNNSSKQSSSSSSHSQPKSFSNSRLALGLSATGPLTLEQVKTAFRLRAMIWHPDHHQGQSKAFADEHFKKINAAHESLCNELSSSSSSTTT